MVWMFSWLAMKRKEAWAAEMDWMEILVKGWEKGMELMWL